jgi:four helix bundle protein
MTHNPDNLLIAQRARELAVGIHREAARHQRRLASQSPSLRTQMLRAADSIALNIAEGAGKSTDRAFAAFLDIAIGSCNELEMQLRLARDISALPESADALVDQVIQVRKMTIGLRRRLKSRNER